MHIYSGDDLTRALQLGFTYLLLVWHEQEETFHLVSNKQGDEDVTLGYCTMRLMKWLMIVFPSTRLIGTAKLVEVLLSLWYILSFCVCGEFAPLLFIFNAIFILALFIFPAIFRPGISQPFECSYLSALLHSRYNIGCRHPATKESNCDSVAFYVEHHDHSRHFHNCKYCHSGFHVFKWRSQSLFFFIILKTGVFLVLGKAGLRDSVGFSTQTTSEAYISQSQITDPRDTLQLRKRMLDPREARFPSSKRVGSLAGNRHTRIESVTFVMLPRQV